MLGMSRLRVVGMIDSRGCAADAGGGSGSGK
jgi:hypothetical protein